VYPLSRKTSKKGKVWGYDVLFNNAETDWQKKRLYMDQLAQAVSVTDNAMETAMH